MSLAKLLWAENADLARAALDHHFVRGLRDGSLPRADFQHYVGQDAYFLEAFARAYALALAHSPGQDGLREFFALLAGVLDELKLHGSYAARWGLDLGRVTPSDATLAYTDFLLVTAALRGSVGETCAAMTPCMRLYAFLGQSLGANNPHDDNPYAEWVNTYASAEFEALAAKLEALLDHYATDTPAVRATYRRAMHLELNFFEASVGQREVALPATRRHTS